MTWKKNWTDFHIRKQTQLYNYLAKTDKKLNLDTFIDVKKRDLHKIIESNSKWGDSNRMAFYYMISRFLDIKNKNDKYVKIYAQHGYDYQQKIEQNTGKNQLDGKEIENYREYGYFKNILDNTPPDDSLKKNYEKLILSLMVLQPPLRTSFYRTAIFITKIKDNNGTDNFVHINKRGTKNVTFIVNNDKASNYKMFQKNPELSFIKIESQELIDFIIDSYTRYPRKYLFENLQTKESLEDNAILKKLRDITKLPAINFQMMRSIYITWYHKNYRTHNDKKKLSLMMRHSVETAGKNYLKVFDEESKDKPKETENINIALENQISELGKENETLAKELDDVKQHCHDAFKPEDKLYIKRRADILYRYNKRGVHPKDSTMNKYKITYNTTNQLYE
jgi:hypothetical protein